MPLLDIKLSKKIDTLCSLEEVNRNSCGTVRLIPESSS